MDVRYVDLPTLKIPRIFNHEHENMLCARDVIAYVRTNVSRDPWVPVVIRTNAKPVALGDLKNANIFWENVNSDEVGNSLGIGTVAHCVVTCSQLTDEEDCGINTLLSEFHAEFDVQYVEVLVVGENDDGGPNTVALSRLRTYILEHGREDIVLPSFLARQNKLLTNGFDISDCAMQIDLQRQRNQLNATLLGNVLEGLKKNVIPGETMIQDLREMRTQDVKLLSTYLILEYHLPPVYISSFISEYVKFSFVYPRTKLSLYERILFLYRLPGLVGYIGKNQQFRCYAQVVKKLYPKPYYVFDLESRKIVEDESFYSLASGSYKFVDYRSMFYGSPTYFESTEGGLVKQIPGAPSDIETNLNLVQTFASLEELVQEEKIFLSVKNTLLATRDGHRYLLYCPEECGMDLILASEDIGHLRIVLNEGEFNQLIDAQLLRAILKRDRAPTVTVGNQELATTWQEYDPSKALKSAIPLNVVLYMDMLPVFENGLSFYDRGLRCLQDVLPINTSLDSELYDVNYLMDKIPLSDLRRDSQAGGAVSCFGTLFARNEQRELPVTYNLFKHKELLEWS